ncbi:DMT family transporter [Octadecabacter ascidiaceicola]|uniref:EamA-like transporter family protein n=1 Tax=Octadecabacter ascidiaceicola TaxID=1655543 RepID=A0A238JL91_9RHOB|nr:DMT family transporter [Octadecabacter ascidiaceicola]SMX31448.1 EamA-like transporter family protein [Octadecabacter ascidiaceicola]
MENLRGAALMTFSMLAFAVEDVLIKTLGSRIPAGQIISVVAAGSVIAFSVWFIVNRQPVIVRDHANPKVWLRSGFDVLGTLFFISALMRMDLTLLSAIIQATPLVVAFGGVMFLGQTVGWRRWAAILVGFCGVLLIIRPSLSGMSFSMVLGILGMVCLAGRDLMTRAIKVKISGPHVSLHAFTLLIFAGLLLCQLEGTPLVLPNVIDGLILVVCVFVVLAAYLAIIAATREGDAAFISMFRYTRMVFALIVGGIFLHERPDALTLIGVAIVIGAGVFTLLREARARRSFLGSPEPL